MATPRVLILRAPGTNCDGEAAFAFERAGAATERLHVNALRDTPALLRRFQILVLPGGFSYGDDVAAGKILASQFRHFLADSVREFRDRDNLILGICNGFQTLLKAGLLVPPDEDGPLATLAHNASGKFEDRWVELAQSVTGSAAYYQSGRQRVGDFLLLLRVQIGRRRERSLALRRDRHRASFLFGGEVGANRPRGRPQPGCRPAGSWRECGSYTRAG
jgi:hypothetical protein